jgi:hypothetical protein
MPRCLTIPEASYYFSDEAGIEVANLRRLDTPSGWK